MPRPGTALARSEWHQPCLSKSQLRLSGYVALDQDAHCPTRQHRDTSGLHRPRLKHFPLRSQPCPPLSGMANRSCDACSAHTFAQIMAVPSACAPQRHARARRRSKNLPEVHPKRVPRLQRHIQQVGLAQAPVHGWEAISRPEWDQPSAR